MLSYFGAQNLHKWTLQGPFTSKDSAETPLTLLSDVVLKLIDYSRLIH